MSEAIGALVLPHQLFKEHPAVEAANKIFLVEARRFFTEFDYHKKKLVFHRASMKQYQHRLERSRHDVTYLEFDESPVETAFSEVEEMHLVDPVDHRMMETLETVSDAENVSLQIHETPMFLTSIEDFRDVFEDREYQMTPFYIEQRKELDVLVEDGEPIGGKWSFDPENREKLPTDYEVPETPEREDTEAVQQATEYVLDNFPENPGTVDAFFYPVTHEQAETWLQHFLRHKLNDFGPYQDAIEEERTFMFHSVLSPLLNTGLLTPHHVVEQTLNAHEEEEYPLNSLEGFLRQIIGWREFMRGIYELEGENLRQSNDWNNHRELPDGFYSGETGLPPVDAAVERVQQYAYTHHIERLMVLGNIMLLSEVNPDKVYEWFMEMFIDAYDWVMVPNVYGMSQYAAGGLFSTKPYISSSNYIRRMSHYESGGWEDIWDGIFWRFIDEHRDSIEKNPRMGVMVSHLDRMDEETLETHRENAERFLKEKSPD